MAGMVLFPAVVASALLLFSIEFSQADPGAPAALAYESCSAENNYFESSDCGWPDDAELSKRFESLDKVAHALVLPPGCVLASLRSTPDRIYKFAACAKNAAALSKDRVVRPCVTEKYHRSTYLAYLDVMNCLGIDPRELFSLLNLESNFQTNIISATGALGVGQLTPSAVHADNAFKRLAPYLAKPQCASLKPLLETPMSETNGCEWIGAPDNPARNMIYAGVSYLAFKGVAGETLKKRKNFAKLNSSDRAHLLFDLTAYMYNGGDGGVRQAFEVFMDEKGDAEMSYEAFRTGFQAFLAESFGDGLPYYVKYPKQLPPKRLEVSGYVAGIERQLKQVEKKAGVKCSL